MKLNHDIKETIKIVIGLAVFGLCSGISTGVVLSIWFHFFWN